MLPLSDGMLADAAMLDSSCRVDAVCELYRKVALPCQMACLLLLHDGKFDAPSLSSAATCAEPFLELCCLCIPY